MGKSGNVTEFIFLGSKATADSDCSYEIKRHLLLERKAMTNLDSMLKSRDHFANKGPSIQSYGFSGSHVWMWELDHKKSWVLKNWCFQFVVLEKTLESPLSSKEIKPSHPLYCPCSPASNLFQYQGLFLMIQFSASGGQMIGVSASASVLPKPIQYWLPLGVTGLISLQSKGLSRVFSNTTVQKHQFFGTQLSL